MANSEDFVQRLILDDSDFLKGMANSTQAAEKLGSEWVFCSYTLSILSIESLLVCVLSDKQ